MATCPYCSHNLLNHLRASNRYWYCTHCRLETSESFICAQSKALLSQSLSLACDRSELITS